MSKTILFNPAMVRAIRAGQKTQTRRGMSPQPELWDTARHGPGQPNGDIAHLWGWQAPKDGPFIEEAHYDWPAALIEYCPYGKPCDRLRVKESAWMWCEIIPNGRTENDNPKFRYVPLEGAPIHYADEHPQKPTYTVDHPVTGNRWGWRFKVGRFLPSFAIRTVLEITKVRVERLQDISEQDATAEGCDNSQSPAALAVGWYEKPRAAFRRVWDQIYKNWDQNPWVWVIEFKVINQ